MEFKLAPPEYPIVRKLKTVHPIRLGSLNRSEIVSLVCKQLDVETVPKQVEDMIAEKAQGNPFYAGEITNSLIESKTIVVENGKCILSEQITDLDKIPETVQVLSSSI